MSEYLILIYQDESAGPEETAAEQTMAGHMRFGQSHGDVIRGGNALQSSDTATSIRGNGSGGFAVTDGAFAETKEALGGYYLIAVSYTHLTLPTILRV